MTPAAALLLGLLARATVVALAALGLRVLIRRRTALRCAAQLGALAALLLLPLLMLGLPPATRFALPVLNPPAASPLAVPRGQRAERRSRPTDDMGGSELQPPAPREPRTRAAWIGDRVAWWQGAFTLLWAVGAGLGLIRLLADLHALRRLARRSAAVGGRLDRLGKHLGARLGIQRPVRLVLSPEIPAPVTWGTLRPVVLLPEAAASWPPGRLALALGHELVHVRSLDHLIAVAIACCRILYWFHPGVRLFARQALGDLERRCDEYLVRDGTRPTVYARTLLDLVRQAPALTPAIGLDGGVGLAERVRHILTIDQGVRVPGRALLVATTVSIAGFGVAGAAVRLTAVPAPVLAAGPHAPATTPASDPNGLAGATAVALVPPRDGPTNGLAARSAEPLVPPRDRPTNDLAAARGLLREMRGGLAADALVRRAEHDILTEWYRAWLYRAVAGARRDPVTHAALVLGAGRITDGYTRWWALEPIVLGSTPRSAGLGNLLEAGLGIDVEHYRAVLLRGLVHRLPADGDLERRFLDGAGTLTDGYLRYQVLEDALTARAWGPSELMLMVDLARGVPASYARRLLRTARASQDLSGEVGRAVERLDRLIRGAEG